MGDVIHFQKQRPVRLKRVLAEAVQKKASCVYLRSEADDVSIEYCVGGIVESGPSACPDALFSEVMPLDHLTGRPVCGHVVVDGRWIRYYAVASLQGWSARFLLIPEVPETQYFRPEVYL
jgi:hypothetical protein